MALLRGPSYCSHLPQAPLTYGQCALGLAQVKAVGLGEVYDLTAVPSPFPLIHFFPRGMLVLIEGGSEVLMNC